MEKLMVTATRTAETNSAVFLMDGNQVSRQMRWSEFGAFLDGYVGLSDLAETDVRSVLVNLHPDLTIASLVFFRIWFDEEGRADGSWNIPIEALAERGAKGPDLGGGAIRLVCRSQCPDPAYADELWDPDMTPGHNHFQSIRKAVEANSLHFRKLETVVEENIPVLTNPATPSLTREHIEIERARLAQVLREQRLRIKTLQSMHRDKVSELERGHRLELQALRADVSGLEQKYERLRLGNEQLKQKLQERNAQYLALQELVGNSAGSLENDASTDAEMVLLREQLERKERELELRDEKILSLERENHELKHRQIPEESLFEQLQGGSVFLVAYHPGVGHMALPYDDIETYFSNPQAYAADKCGMNEAAYREWLAHYENPVCNHGEPGPCGEPIMRVSQPADFTAGIDDRCEQHKT
ncbi:MAG TPA: DNA repair protein [Marinobacter sp.]|nr:DNA repair protein [Marinobacter sp.]